jgi:hypothetical protein
VTLVAQPQSVTVSNGILILENIEAIAGLQQSNVPFDPLQTLAIAAERY